jgi:hypothetical protein
MRSVFVSIVVSALLAGCSHEMPPAANAPPQPSSAPPVPIAKAETSVNADLKVYTLHEFTPHSAMTRGRWYRRVANGWEQASCSTSFTPDPEAGPQDRGPACDAWKPVPSAAVPAVERARAIGPEIICAKNPDVCASLGLRDESESIRPPMPR